MSLFEFLAVYGSFDKIKLIDYLNYKKIVFESVDTLLSWIKSSAEDIDKIKLLYTDNTFYYVLGNENLSLTFYKR